MTEHGAATRVAELVKSLNTLRVDHPTGTPAPCLSLEAQGHEVCRHKILPAGSPCRSSLTYST